MYIKHRPVNIPIEIYGPYAINDFIVIFFIRRSTMVVAKSDITHPATKPMMFLSIPKKNTHTDKSFMSPLPKQPLKPRSFVSSKSP